MPVSKDFTDCPHCVLKGKPRRLRPATHRTPHISRSDGRSFHVFLEESSISRPSGGQEQEVVALFRYDLDPAREKSESTLVTIHPAGATTETVLAQLEYSADRLAAILESGQRLQKSYNWNVE
ncbi:MAG TPA: hypothetical protein VK473_02645 [Terriglobales bacterium]|nr:hypothetical protein [Terriglobales bacterium]